MRIDKGTKLILVQHTWGEGKLNIENIGRVYSGKNVSVIAKQHTSPCIQVTHDGEILDQIFISIPPDWNLMTQDYRVDTERLYYVPPGEVGDSPPKVADSCGVPQQTQESVKSLAPGVPLKLSQLSAKEEKEEKKIVDSIFGNGMDDDPVQMFYQTYTSPITTAVDGTQEPKQGASLDIYKTIALPSAVAHADPDNSEPEVRGTIFDCAAVYTGLTATQQYKHLFGYVYRQEYTPSSSCNPLNDLQDRIKSKKGVDFRDRSAYFLGRSTLSMADAHELALHLAPSYKEEFTALFESEEAFQAELHNVQNNVNFFSPIMVTVIARALLCPIILFLPDKDKPVYFYPYPMKDGEPSPQFGDYQRPAMRLTLWTDSQLSLLVPVGYDDKLVDCTPSRIVKKDSKNVKGKDVKGKDVKGKDGKGKDGKGKDGKGEEDEREEVEGKQTRIHLFPYHLHQFRGKKKKHYVEDDKGKPVLKPGFTILTYHSLDDDRLVEAEALCSKMSEYLQEHYPRDDEKVYNISDIQQDLFENGFFKFRNNIVIPSRDPLNYLCVSKALPPGHLAVDNPYLSGSQGRQKCVTYETVCAYRRESIDRVHELANNELKSEIDKCMLSGFLDSNMENHPTMTRALGHIDLFHSTPVSPSNGQLQVFDVHYIRAIDKANGPYKGDSNSGDQISGGEWFDELSEEVQVQVKAFHLKYCHLPAWMISISGHIAISKHMTLEDIHSKCVYAGTTGLGANYFSRYKADRSSYVSLQRHTIWNIPCSLAREAQFRAVGDNTLGCDQLAKSYFPVPLTTVVEATYESEIFVMESGCEVSKVFANGNFCVPVSVTFGKECCKYERHKEIVQQVINIAKNKQAGTMTAGTGKKKKKTAKKPPTEAASASTTAKKKKTKATSASSGGSTTRSTTRGESGKPPRGATKDTQSRKRKAGLETERERCSASESDESPKKLPAKKEKAARRKKSIVKEALQAEVELVDSDESPKNMQTKKKLSLSKSKWLGESDSESIEATPKPEKISKKKATSKAKSSVTKMLIDSESDESPKKLPAKMKTSVKKKAAKAEKSICHFSRESDGYESPQGDMSFDKPATRRKSLSKPKYTFEDSDEDDFEF